MPCPSILFMEVIRLRKEQMERIALSLLLHSNLETVAKENNISLSGLYKLRKQDVFKRVMQEKKNDYFRTMSDKMQGYSLESVEMLMEIIRDPDAKDGDRISAIRIVLDGAAAAHERDEILPRLEETEKVMKELLEHMEGKNE